MSWWNETPSLTPVAAWDALRVNGAVLTDAVGSNHITRTSDAGVSSFQTIAAAGDSNRMALATPLVIPTTGVVVAYWKIARRNVLLSGDALGGVTNWWFHQSETHLRWMSNKANVASYYGDADSYHKIGVNFAAMVNDGVTSKLFLNGAFFGTSIPVGSVMTSIYGVGYGGNGNEYNLDADEGLSALGVFTGTPTLLELQTLEAKVRADFVGIQPSYRGLAPMLGRLDNSPPEGRTPFGPGGKWRGSPRSAYTAYFGGPGVLTGTVKEKNQPTNLPLYRKVQLYDATTSTLVRETWSHAVTGTYVFEGLALNVPYTVISYDHTGLYRAVIADNQVAELP